MEEFINYLKEQVRNHSIYVWGGHGQDWRTITESWIKKCETSTKNATRAIGFWKKQVKAGYGKALRAFDCSGLVMYYLLDITRILKKDMSANGLMGLCKMLQKEQLQQGDWVFRVYKSGKAKGRAYHIGYIIDDVLNVIEAKGRDDGVIRAHLDAFADYWNAYGRPLMFM